MQLGLQPKLVKIQAMQKIQMAIKELPKRFFGVVS